MKRGCIYSAAGVSRNFGEGAGNFGGIVVIW